MAKRNSGRKNPSKKDGCACTTCFVLLGGIGVGILALTEAISNAIANRKSQRRATARQQGQNRS